MIKNIYPIFIFLVFISISIGSIDIGQHIVLVDGYGGFDNNTLNINSRETVTWVNDDPTDILTIVSDQSLFSDAQLDSTGMKFNYVFDNPGSYTFHIKEYPGYEKLTITVSTMEGAYLTDNKTEEIKENEMQDNITGNNIDDINDSNNRKKMKYESIFIPLNIFKNMKKTGIIIFAFIMLVLILRNDRS